MIDEATEGEVVIGGIRSGERYRLCYYIRYEVVALFAPCYEWPLMFIGPPHNKLYCGPHYYDLHSGHQYCEIWCTLVLILWIHVLCVVPLVWALVYIGLLIANSCTLVHLLWTHVLWPTYNDLWCTMVPLFRTLINSVRSSLQTNCNTTVNCLYRYHFDYAI